MSRLFKDTSIYTLGRILPSLINLFLLPLYTKYLTTSEFGIVASMQVLSTLLAVFLTLGLERSIYRLYWDFNKEEQRRKYLGTIMLTITIISSVILGLLFCLRSTVSLIFPTIPFHPFYTYALLSIYFSLFGIVPLIYFQLKQKPIEFVSISFLQFLLLAGLTIHFVIFRQEGAAGMLKAMLCSNLILLPLNLIISYNIATLHISGRMLSDALCFSLPMIPALLSTWVMDLSDRIFIERYFSLSDVGIYSLAYKLASIATLIAASFSQAYNPIFYKLANSDDQHSAKEKLSNYNHTYILCVMLVCFGISLVSKELITIFFAPNYRPAFQLVPIIAFGYYVYQCSGLLNLSFYQDKKTMTIMVIATGAAILNIVLNYALVPLYGSFGAAYATCLSFSAIYGVKYYYARKCYFVPVRWEIILPLTGLLAIIFLLSNSININPYVSLFIKLVILFGLLVIILRGQAFRTLISDEN